MDVHTLPLIDEARECLRLAFVEMDGAKDDEPTAKCVQRLRKAMFHVKWAANHLGFDLFTGEAKQSYREPKQATVQGDGCRKCGSTETRQDKVSFKNGQGYHVRLSCSKCNKYIRFLPHAEA